MGRTERDVHRKQRKLSGQDGPRWLPLAGFSPRLYTATVDYQWNSLQARTDYYYRGDYIEGLGGDIENDEFFGEEQRLDAEVHLWLLDLELRPSATATNLTGEPQVSYQGYPRSSRMPASGCKYVRLAVGIPTGPARPRP